MYTNMTNLRILYIEDDKFISQNYMDFFKKFKALAKHVDNYEDAQKAFKKNMFDIVISDINLPTKNGIEFVKYARGIDKYIPIIITSGYTDLQYLLDSIDFNVTKYFVKPYKESELFGFIDDLAKEINQKDKKTIFSDDSYYSYNKKCYVKNGVEVKLNFQETTLLEHLIENSNVIVPYEDLQKALAKKDKKAISINTLRTVVKNLRKKTDEDILTTHSGFGYKIAAKV